MRRLRGSTPSLGSEKDQVSGHRDDRRSRQERVHPLPRMVGPPGAARAAVVLALGRADRARRDDDTAWRCRRARGCELGDVDRVFGCDDVGRREVVDGETVLAHPSTIPSRHERQPGDPTVRHRASGARQTERDRGLRVDVAVPHPTRTVVARMRTIVQVPTDRSFADVDAPCATKTSERDVVGIVNDQRPHIRQPSGPARRERIPADCTDGRGFAPRITGQPEARVR
jgi:hypothetical protein